MMASMRNGSGDHWFALQCAAGTALHGLSHEAPTFRPGEPQQWVFDGLPAQFHENLLQEPAFDTANSTFCIWRLASDSSWQCGAPGPAQAESAEDGSAELLSILAGDPQQYVDFASDTYEADVALADVEAIYRHVPLTSGLATRLNKDIDHEALQVELAEIGYPEAG